MNDDVKIAQKRINPEGRHGMKTCCKYCRPFTGSTQSFVGIPRGGYRWIDKKENKTNFCQSSG